MATTPGALVGDGSALPPSGPIYLLTSGSSRGPATQFTTASVAPSINRLQLVAILNTGTAEPPLSVQGAGVPWALVSNRILTIGPVCLSLWRAMGNVVAGPLTIRYVNAQNDCAWSWCESEEVAVGLNGAGAIIQVNSGVIESIAPTQRDQNISLNTFAATTNKAYGAFLHNKPDSSPVSATPGLGFSRLHEIAVPVDGGLGYTASLFTEFQNAIDQSVDVQWSAPGSMIGIALEIGNSNTRTDSFSIDLVVLGNLLLQTVMDGFVRLPLSLLATFEAAIIDIARANCQVDAVITSDKSWTVLDKPSGVSINRWEVL